MMSDDFALHKSDNVKRLCWSRAYVSINHGGGGTPVRQTPDTDLNQRVRREYTGLESSTLIQQMRAGQSVPRAEEEDCVDMMHDVLISKALHLHAADGYKKNRRNCCAGWQ